MKRKLRLIILILIIIAVLLALQLIPSHLTQSIQKNSDISLATEKSLHQSPTSKEQLESKTPAEALARLKAGNLRFVQENLKKADFSRLVDKTAESQHPSAIVLSCIDSRVPPEIVFDQAIGNIFVSRVAGEVISPDIIAGMEYATAVTGSKLIVVLGHGNCGAVKAACQQVKMGNITELLNKIQPAVSQTQQQLPQRSCTELEYINQIAINNVKNIVTEIPKQSHIIKDLIDKGQVEIIGAMYDIDSGEVTFFS